MARAKRRALLGLLLLGLVVLTASQVQPPPEAANSTAAELSPEGVHVEEEADDGGGDGATEGVCLTPTLAKGGAADNVTASLDYNATAEEPAPNGTSPQPAQALEPTLQPSNDSAAAAASNRSAEAAPAVDEEEQHNFALERDGAKVIAANKEAKKVQALLDDDSDTYLKNDCRADKWFILELAQVAKVNRFELSQFELYSSRVRHFEVRGRQSHPRTDGVEYGRGLNASAWKLLGNYTAEKVKGTQSFAIEPSAWVRYLLLKFQTHYGSEPVCALNAFSVFGKSAAEELEDQLASEEPLDYLGSALDNLVPPAAQPEGESQPPAGDGSGAEGVAVPPPDGSNSSEASGAQDAPGGGQAPGAPVAGNDTGAAAVPVAPNATDNGSGAAAPPVGEEGPATSAAANETNAVGDAGATPSPAPAAEQAPPNRSGGAPVPEGAAAVGEGIAPPSSTAAPAAPSPAAAAAAAPAAAGQRPPDPAAKPAEAAADSPAAAASGNATQEGAPPAADQPPPPEPAQQKPAPPPAPEGKGNGQPPPPPPPAAANGQGEGLDDLPLSMRPSKPKGSASVYDILVQEIKGAKVGQKLLIKGLADLQRNLTALSSDVATELAAVAGQLAKLATEQAAALADQELNQRLESLVKSHLLGVAADVQALQSAAAGVARREHAALCLLAMLGAAFALSRPGFARDWPRARLLVIALALGNGLVGLLLHIRSRNMFAPSLRALA